jgi:hypothetical protein
VTVSPTQSASAEQSQPTIAYYAPLAGYGSEQEAQKLVNRLAHHRIDTHIKKRQGKTMKKNKAVVWYQVVTDTYTNKADLVAMVDTIKNVAHIKDIQILSC